MVRHYEYGILSFAWLIHATSTLGELTMHGKKLGLTLLASITLFGCVTTGTQPGSSAEYGPPAPLPKVQFPGQTYTVFVPSDVDRDDKRFEGLFFDMADYPSPTIFAGLRFAYRYETAFTPAGISVKSCYGELKRQGGMSSHECGLFEGKARSEKQTDGSTKITLYDFTLDTEYQPNRVDLGRLLGGKGAAQGLAMGNLYNYLNDHTITKTGEVYIAYPPESVKANFDRKFKRNGQHNQQLSKYRTRYVFVETPDMVITAGLEFFPNKNGTMIEYKILGETKELDRGKRSSVDWRVPMGDAVKSLQRVGGL